MQLYLVKWKIKSVSSQAMEAVLKMPDYIEELRKTHKLEKRYHIVGGHGGIIILHIGSHEELERILALMPIYNIARFKIYPLTEMLH